LGFIAVCSAFRTPVCMTMFMEKPLSDELPVDDYLLESTDPRWNKPATLNSVRTAVTRLDSRIDWVFFTLDNKIDRKFTELDNKIDRKFAEADNKIDRKFAEADNKIDRKFSELDNKIDRKFSELDTKMDRKFAETDTKIEIRFKSVERNARINYVLSGIIAFCSLIGALGVFLK
jgi:cytochrome c biogenesis protein ResB